MLNTITRVTSYTDLDVQMFSFVGKGRVAKPKKRDYRPSFYFTVDGSMTGSVRITRLVSGEGFSLKQRRSNRAPVYLRGEALVTIWYPTGEVDTVTLQAAWDYWSTH